MTLVSVVVAAYGEEPWLGKCVESLLESVGVQVEILLVDNGCTSDAVQKLEGKEGIVILRPGLNLGFAGGNNLGASKASGEVIMLCNSDAYVAPQTVNALSETVLRSEVGIAAGSIRLAERPEVINSAGNPLHFLAVSWAGGHGDPASNYPDVREVPIASGAGMALRKEVWERLGGFDETYFGYHEDVYLSLRCRQLGLRVVYVPSAAVFHHYEFSRNPQKFHLIERNRLILLFTLFQTKTLLMISPALLAFELGTLVVSIFQGWFPAKVTGWWWLFVNRGWLLDRRRELQSDRTVPDRVISRFMTGSFRPGNIKLPRIFRPIDFVLQLYWLLIRRFL